MKLRAMLLLFAPTLAALAQDVSAPPTNHWRAFTKADGLPGNACRSVTIGAGGNVLVRHTKGNTVTVFDGYEMTSVPAPATIRGRVFESPGGQLWAVAPDGLQEFREGEWVLFRVPEIAAHFRAGRTNEITLLPVRQGRVLILLPDRLLQLNAEDADHVQVEQLRGADQTPLGAFTAMTLALDGGLWISGGRGFARITGPLRNLKPDDAWTTTRDMPPELKARQLPAISPDEISVRRIFDAAVEPDGTLWLATSDGLFRRLSAIWEPAERRSPDRPDPSSGSMIRADSEIGASPALPDEIQSRTEWPTHFTAQNGDLWLGGAHGIAWRHQDAWRFFSSTNQIGPEGVVGFAEAPDGRVWCATSDKVWAFDGKNWFALRSGFERINRLCGARDGTLWVATDNGVHRFLQGAWIANGLEDGLSSAVVYSVSEDKLGQITAVTANGVSLFRSEADPDPPKTFIRTTGERELSFREGTLVELAFSGRDKWKVTAANLLLFSYRLDEREWSPFQELQEISFTDLPLGKHYFQVRAMDRNGNIDPKPARLEFVVALPWYRETRLVLVLAVALVVALFSAGVAFNRHRLLLRSYAVVEEQVAARTHELELANRELLHSQKMNALGALAAGIAHDFNNILSIVKGSAQIIEDNLDNPVKIRTRADRIKTVVEQGAGIVQAMLGFSRTSDAQPAPCDLNAVVDDTLKLLGDRFRREVEIRFERTTQLPEVSAAKDLIQQILLNFIFNAAEAMERGASTRIESGSRNHEPVETGLGTPTAPSHPRKQVILTTQPMDPLPSDIVLLPARASAYVSVSVRDCGSGITPENLPRIFEPFFTTKALSTRRGTGLGLSMVYELAKKMKAGLAVESVVGQGSTFTLILPMRDLPVDAKPEANARHAA